MTKRQRIDSVNGAASAMKGATSKIDPPDWVDVPEEAMPFWYSIVHTRAFDRWTMPDLEMAAELARTKSSIERLNKELREEGDTLVNERGTVVTNPKHTILETLTRRMVALSRSLQVHAEATQGKSRDQVKANQAQKKSRETIEEADDLIARPQH